MEAPPATHRAEPLLWLQLLTLGFLPLEALALMLVLAGSDPGPLPTLERILCWAIGGLAPALLLWTRPADVWSLLLIQVPLRARTVLQQRLSRLQDAPLLRAGLAPGLALSLALLWWTDRWSAVAGGFSPFGEAPRLVTLLLAAVLLAVMLWQWQQLLQALWLLSRSPAAVAGALPMAQSEVERSRLALGLPLLLLEPLKPGASGPATGAPGPQSAGQPGEGSAPPRSPSVASAVAVEPEETTEEHQSPELDQQVD